MIQLSVGLLGGIFLIYLATLNWQLSVKVALVLAVIEGALRKWALPQASQLIYFLKDFVLLGAYLSYFSGFYGRWMLGIKNKALSILILLMLGCCLLQI